MKNAVCVLIVGSLLAGCSSLKASMDYSDSADFSQFETFKYEATQGTVATSNPLVHQRIVGAIQNELELSGLTEADSNPDVYVTYYSSVSQEVVVNTTHAGYHRSPHHWHGSSFGHSTTTVSTFDRGTLIIDLWEAKSDELAWRGTVSDVLSSNPERNAQNISRGIATVFLQFPPRSAR